MRRSARRERTRQDFDRFVASSAPGLLRTAYLVCWDLPSAEDLVQECLFQVARRWPRVGSMEYPAAYARRVLVNLALSGASDRSRRRGELTGEGGSEAWLSRQDPAEQALGLAATAPELLEALKELAPRQRAVLALRYFDDLTESETAEALGCSVGTVKSTASRALERLRQSAALKPMERTCLRAPRALNHERST